MQIFASAFSRVPDWSAMADARFTWQNGVRPGLTYRANLISVSFWQG